MAEIDAKYLAFYRARSPRRVYPVEFVVRALLGKYPRHELDRAKLVGGRALDLGFGDGRNMPLLSDLGLKVSGVEIEEAICSQATELMRTGYGIDIDARVGRNVSIPFEDGVFDVVLACHACYYVDDGFTFADNAREIARVTKPGGVFIFSAPMSTSYVLRDGEDVGTGHVRVTRDPYGVRNGYVLKKFDNEAEIKAALDTYFTNFSTGSARNDWWGIEEQVWIVSCTRI